MKHVIAYAALAVVIATAGQAGKREADACAAGLEPDAKKIYDRVLPKVTTDKAANEAMFKATVKKMVNDGEVEFFGVRGRARAAADCIQKINS